MSKALSVMCLISAAFGIAGCGDSGATHPQATSTGAQLAGRWAGNLEIDWNELGIPPVPGAASVPLAFECTEDGRVRIALAGQPYPEYSAQTIGQNGLTNFEIVGPVCALVISQTQGPDIEFPGEGIDGGIYRPMNSKLLTFVFTREGDEVLVTMRAASSIHGERLEFEGGSLKARMRRM